ncbi:NlpC/P60 family protein [Rhodococcus sp. NPDC003318]|uniref:NlpC/P60 family protein n=1 Tax=Rhodococcus sp. NPDC003318 TaxID=3364503 RepID=UPI0036B4CCED
MIAVDVLARPLTDLVATFGTGALPADGPPQALAVASAALDSAHAIGKLALAELGAVWSGAAAEGAQIKAEQAQVQQVQLSERGTEIASVLTAASEVVGAGLAELQSIVASFVSTAVSAGPALATPAGQVAIVASAIDHLSRGMAVVARVRAELCVHTAAMAEMTAPDPALTPAGTVQAAVRPTAVTPTLSLSGLQQRGDAFSGFVQGFADAASSAPGPACSEYTGSPAPAPVAGGTGSAASSDCSGGVEVFLPDGSTAMAPNREAAEAVRNALSQQGVPYSWGGTTPGQGLDCSGLTQWAYGEAGVEIPRLAQEQNVGCPVDQTDLMPGDLAVWDGHVAMVIGNGQMIEAGDPVQVSAVRTANMGMGFYGFYRPTV